MHVVYIYVHEALLVLLLFAAPCYCVFVDECSAMYSWWQLINSIHAREKRIYRHESVTTSRYRRKNRKQGPVHEFHPRQYFIV